MSSESNRPLVSLLDELDRLTGVRGSLVATVDGAYQASERGVFDAATATDIAKTVRRTTLKGRIGGLRQSLSSGGAGESSVSNNVVSEPEDEVDRLMNGELGPVLRDVQAVFTTYVVHGGKNTDDASVLMREQMREWLLCCNPSPYTFPLLIDGLSQVLTDRQGERATFMNDVQAAMRNSKLWAGKR